MKKNVMKKKIVKMFISNFFFISLESSETHIDLVASKFGVKLIISSNFSHLWWYFGHFCKKIWTKNWPYLKIYKSQISQVSENCESLGN